MKKYATRRRARDVRLGVKFRKYGKLLYVRNSRRKKGNNVSFVQRINIRIDQLIEGGLDADITDKHVTIYLPEHMNLSDRFDETIPYINAINILSDSPRTNRIYRLGSVVFDQLKQISSSAALLLTASLSRWDDNSRNALSPQVHRWSYGIYEKLLSLGFFDLFRKPFHQPAPSGHSSTVQLVKYIKGNSCNKEYKRLKEQLHSIIGSSVSKWNFLHGGLDEAITNVGHHAYPSNCGVKNRNQNWYLTGAYDKSTKELKVVFCDQGVGIPASLPASKLWEHVLSHLSLLPAAARQKHATLLKAAMEVDRTRTGESDRGKGLPDMKEFILQRGEGYLSLLSGFGLYKLTVENGVEYVKSETLRFPIYGTLIIWKAQL